MLRNGFTAIRCTGSSPTIVECVITQNWGDSGAGLLSVDSAPTLIGCAFIENFADGGSGAAISQVHGALTLTNCTFTRNAAYGFGITVLWRGSLL